MTERNHSTHYQTPTHDVDGPTNYIYNNSYEISAWLPGSINSSQDDNFVNTTKCSYSPTTYENRLQKYPGCHNQTENTTTLLISDMVSIK